MNVLHFGEFFIHFSLTIRFDYVKIEMYKGEIGLSPIMHKKYGGEFMNGLLLMSAAAQYSDITVAALGLGTVFFGLICIIFICLLFGKIFASASKRAASAPAPAAPAVQAELSAEEKGAVIAAVSAVIAEELGTDVSALRIHSFKKI